MSISFRAYDHVTDFDAAVRLWKEVGWLAKGEEERLRWFVEESRGIVAEVDGTVECLTLMSDGRMRYLDDDLSLAACTGVTTGRAARKLGLARRALARSLAAEARRGMAVSALGVFEQGFYDALGYGTGSYAHRARFDPSRLRTTASLRRPVRLTSDDWREMHSARLARRHMHGTCDVLSAGVTRMEVADEEKQFGLGYRDGLDGELTHFVWIHAEEMEQGPYRAELVFQTGEQLHELIALLKSLGDQVLSVSMREPPGMMVQDWLDRPFRLMNVTEDGKHEANITASAYWQVRILDLHACIAAFRGERPGVRFNLVLHYPVADYAGETGWQGIGGRYVVSLGRKSNCRPGNDPGLPTMQASVNAFSRLWLGVCPATGLAITDDLHAPNELLECLDVAFRLPVPQPDWDF